MKKTFRLSMTWLHTWTGLVVCWLLYFIFLTGTLGYFDNEIDLWMKPELNPVTQQPLAQDLQAATAYLQQRAPDAERWYISPANHRENQQLKVYWRYQGKAARAKNGDQLVDNQTGAPLAHRDTGGGQKLYKMHYRLSYLPSIGYEIVGLATMILFIGLITGVIAHRKIFADFFSFRFHKRKLALLDLHNVSSIATLPFQLMITYSGLIFVASTWMPFIVYGAYGFDQQALENRFAQRRSNSQIQATGTAATPLALSTLVLPVNKAWGEDQVQFIEIRYPGDQSSYITFNRHKNNPSDEREKLSYSAITGEQILKQGSSPLPQQISNTFINLHEGLFAGPIVRWLYFISGILGCLMIGTGAIRYVDKRRSRSQAQSGTHRALEIANVGTICGLPLAICGYFIANRLLPAGFAERADWEVHTMFIIWLCCFIYPVFRPHKRCWLEMLGATIVALLLVPLINALTSDRGLWNAYQSADWSRFYFDLSHLITALIVLWLTLKLKNSYQAKK